MLEAALAHLVRDIVDYPDDVTVHMHTVQRGYVFKIAVHSDDLGRAIGRSGKTIKAVHAVISALADGAWVRIDFVE